MSLLRRLRERLVGSRSEGPPIAAGPKQAPEPHLAADEADSSDLTILRSLVTREPDSVETLLGALERCRGSDHERAALEVVLAARVRATVPEPVALVAAEMLEQRGERGDALELLKPCRSTAALLLAADLRAEQGEVARALLLVERVLANNLHAPGARERHRRFRQMLNIPEEPPLASSAPTLLQAGLDMPRLRIVGEAGRGGAGAVYEAVDELLGRRIALKIYHRPREERDKLEREARLAVAFNGQGVVRIYDVDPVRGLITMEWAAGGALRGLLSERPLGLWPIDSWFVPLVKAVARVHAAGFVHADVKPANVLFRGAHDPILSDFGLAGRIGDASEGGSRGFLSPERELGKTLDPSDDVFSLGRILDNVLDRARSAPGGPDERELEPLRVVAQRALGPRETRPADALCLLRTVEGVLPVAPAADQG